MKQDYVTATGLVYRLVLVAIAMSMSACGGGSGDAAGVPPGNDTAGRVLGDAAGGGDVTPAGDATAGVCKSKTFTPWQAKECVEATCSNKNKYMGQAIKAAIDKAVACSADDDCVIVTTSTKCSGTCGEAINKIHKDAVSQVVKWADANICAIAGPDSPCPYATPGCIAPKPGCEAGKCVYRKKAPPAGCAPPQPANTECAVKSGKWVCLPKTFTPWQAKECVEASCSNKNKYAVGAITEAITKAKACSADADCLIVQTSTKCGGTCGEAVNKSQLDTVTEVVKWVDANICAVAGADSPCPFSEPSCIAPEPGCVNKACVYIKP